MNLVKSAEEAKVQAAQRKEAELADARDAEAQEREKRRAEEEKERLRLAQLEEQRRAEEEKERLRLAHEELLEKQRQLLHSIKPHEKRRKTPMRQISFMVTEEEHENIAANARALGLTMRALIAKCLHPITEKMKTK